MMSYIWGYGEIPDYLTAIARVSLIPNEFMITLSNGKFLSTKELHYIIKDSKQVSNDKFYKFDMLNETVGVPLVNQRVLSILEKECSGKFQSIPAIINLPDGNKVEGYYVINVTNKVPVALLDDCVKKNEYKDDNDIRGYIFAKKAFKSSIIEEEDLCRDSVIGSNLVFISERLRKIFRKEKIKGGGFHKSLRDSVIFV